MKIKVYSLASDGDDGTRATVFGTEAELHAAMREAIEEDIDGDATENADAIRLLLEAGDIKAAWSDWQELITPKFFRCEKGEHEIELPQVDALIGAATYVECRLADACDYGVQDKSPFYPSWRKITEALKPFSPAPTVSA